MHARVVDVDRSCFSELQGGLAAAQPSPGFATQMSGEGHLPSSTLVQSLITSYYVVRDPPQLVQQRITHYYPVCDFVDEGIESVGQHFTTHSCDSPSDDVSSSTHVSETPTSKVGDISWYLHHSNQALQSRERLVQNPNTLFGSYTFEDGLHREELDSYPNCQTPSPVLQVSKSSSFSRAFEFRLCTCYATQLMLFDGNMLYLFSTVFARRSRTTFFQPLFSRM